MRGNGKQGASLETGFSRCGLTFRARATFKVDRVYLFLKTGRDVRNTLNPRSLTIAHRYDTSTAPPYNGSMIWAELLVSEMQWRNRPLTVWRLLL